MTFNDINTYIMTKESRTHKTLLNVKVSFIFYFITLVISFLSRKIFLENLGADFIGLTGTLGSILGLLNFAELGIGTAISFTLYKPLFEQNKQQINEIISIFGYLYRNIGLFILFLGIIVSFFLPKIFDDTNLPTFLIFFAYYSFLLSSLATYLINYRQVLLGADQKNYIVTGYYQTSLIIKNIIQLLICSYTQNYYLWLIIEFIFGFVYCFIVNWKINQAYPWLDTNIKSGKHLLKSYPIIVKKIKQIFTQRIGYTILGQVTQPLIYAYSSLQLVALYGNYILIIDRISSLFNMTMSGITASIGNLVAEGNTKYLLKVFWELRAFRYWGAFVIVFAINYLIEPFITLWLGDSYILPKNILYIILANIFLQQTRLVVMQFTNAHGLFQDVWSPIVESGITIFSAIFLGKILGITGVLLGTTISLVCIFCLWKPYFLYKKGFKLPLFDFYIKTFVFILISSIVWTVFHQLLPYVKIDAYKNFTQWFLYSLVIVIPYSITTWILYYIFTQGMKDLSKRIFLLLKNTFNERILKRL